MRDGFGRGFAALIIATALLLIAGLISVRVYTAILSDRRVAEREEALVANGVQGWIAEVESWIVGQTTWDDAALNLGLRFDPGWARENIGKFLHDTAGFQQAYVLDGQGRPVYAMQNGRDCAVTAFDAIERIATPLVSKVRTAERARRRLPAATRSSHTAPPVQSSTVGLIGGLPSIVSATLVQSDYDRIRLPGPAPIVITVWSMDARFQDKFSDRFLLTGLHVRARPTGQVEAGEARTLLRNAQGEPVAQMDWSPQRPAWKLLPKTMPSMILAILVFCAIAATVFARGRRAAQALMASETQAKHMAYHDHLTGLPNRALFADRLAHALADLRRDGRPLGVLALDLDRFKIVNDTYGHAAGDELIIDIAKRLKNLARDNDTVARLALQL